LILYILLMTHSVVILTKNLEIVTCFDLAIFVKLCKKLFVMSGCTLYSIPTDWWLPKNTQLWWVYLHFLVYAGTTGQVSRPCAAASCTAQETRTSCFPSTKVCNPNCDTKQVGSSGNTSDLYLGILPGIPTTQTAVFYGILYSSSCHSMLNNLCSWYSLVTYFTFYPSICPNCGTSSEGVVPKELNRDDMKISNFFLRNIILIMMIVVG